MKIKTEFPHKIREIENCWISMADGARLAARIWLPEDAENNPVPGILEYIPYRKNDGTATRDAIQQPYFAGHGYAVVRVDLRGSGDSDGLLLDEYLLQEQMDGLEVLTWMAAQAWCDGNIGMIGKSWGGFNGLQIAAHRPSELKAIISVCSTDDRYADDVHYMGGCLLANDQLTWASSMLVRNALPPDPQFVGDRWREMWFERMEQSPPYIEAWMTHQRRDAFWQQGSVCENYADTSCAVYAIGGWADAYSNAIFRLLAGLPGPCKGLIGPWAHLYAQSGIPGPAIGFLQECLRWWDYWLKGIDTGIMDEPMFRVWMQDSIEPDAHCQYWPGRWVAEPAWPSPDVTPQSYYLNMNTLDQIPENEAQLAFQGTLQAGQDGSIWCAHGLPADLPPDQRAEDGRSLTFTSPPLTEPMEILGFPEVILTVSVDQPNALLAVRLCDISPTGASTLISRGLLNLTHRDSHEFPTPLEPGKQYTVTVRLNGVAHSLSVGHRWRVAVSPTYWPWAWPSPHAVTLQLFTGEKSKLILPIRPTREGDSALPAFAEPETAPPLAVQEIRSSTRAYTVQHDVVHNTYQIVDGRDGGRRRILANGLETESYNTNTYTITEGEPLSAHVQCDRMMQVGRGDWQIRIETISTMTADAETFHITNLLEAYEGKVRAFTKTWHFSVPRDLV
jgi:putative CocE/NonD family hydrolase